MSLRKKAAACFLGLSMALGGCGTLSKSVILPPSEAQPLSPDNDRPMTVGEREMLGRLERYVDDLNRAEPWEHLTDNTFEHMTLRDLLGKSYGPANLPKVLEDVAHYRATNPGLYFLSQYSPKALDTRPHIAEIPADDNNAGTASSKGISLRRDDRLKDTRGLAYGHELFHHATQDLGNPERHTVEGPAKEDNSDAFTTMRLTFAHNTTFEEKVLFYHEGSFFVPVRAITRKAAATAALYLLRPEEMEVRLAEVNRTAAVMTGNPITTPDDALRFYKGMGFDIDSAMAAEMAKERGVPLSPEALSTPPLHPRLIQAFEEKFPDIAFLKAFVNGAQDFSTILDKAMNNPPQNYAPARQSPDLYKHLLKQLLFKTPGLAQVPSGPNGFA